MQFSAGAWQGHPFHPDNNVNGIDADTDRDRNGLEIYTLANTLSSTKSPSPSSIRWG